MIFLGISEFQIFDMRFVLFFKNKLLSNSSKGFKRIKQHWQQTSQIQLRENRKSESLDVDIMKL